MPIVRAELEALVAAGCRDVCVDEPSMSCYAHREDPRRFVDLVQRHGRGRAWSDAALDAPVLRQLQGPRGGAAQLCAAVPGVSRRARRRTARRDGESRVRRARRDRSHRPAHGRRGRHHRREELLHRDARGRGRARSPLPGVRTPRSGWRSRPTAASARPRAGRRGASSRTWSKASGACARSSGCRDRPGAEGRRSAARHRRRRRARRARAPLVAGAEWLPGAVRRRPPAARSVPVGFAHREVREHRQAARADDRTRDRSGAPRLHRRRHLEPQPHRPSRRGDARAAAPRQSRHGDGHRRRQPRASSRARVCRSTPEVPLGLRDRRARGRRPVPHRGRSCRARGARPAVRRLRRALWRRGRCITRATPCATTAWPTCCALTPSTSPCSRSTDARRSGASPATSTRSRPRRSRTTSARAWPFPATTRCSRSTRQTPRRSSRPAVPVDQRADVLRCGEQW